MKKTILLLFGGPSEESYLSERSAKFIFKNIDNKIFNIIPVKWDKNDKFFIYDEKFNSVVKVYDKFLNIIQAIDFDLIFNLFHGKDECNGMFNGFLEFLKIPYIGNPMYTNFLGFNKFYTKLIFNFLNIRTPKYILIRKDVPFSLENLKFPIIIKPALSGSSIGLNKVENEKEATIWIRELFQRGFDEIIAEEFIKGDEYSVCVIGDYRVDKKIILPVGKINYPCEIFDEKSKYEGVYKVEVPSGLDESLEKELVKISLRLHNFLKSKYITRTDFIVKDEQLFVLEINTSPGLSSHSIITQILSKSNYNLNEILSLILNQA